MNSSPATAPPGAYLSRVSLSIGTLDLLRFSQYDHAFPRHSHEEFTVGAFETGNGSLGYRRASWRAYDGTVLAVPPDEVHTAEPLRGQGWTYRALYPSATLMSVALGHASSSAVPAFFDQPIYHDPPLARTIALLHALLASGERMFEAEAGLVTSLHALVARHGMTRPPERCETAVTRIVATAREYLHEHYASAIKLATLAAVCGTSPFHLVRSFTEVASMPPHAYLTQIRANRARALLVSGEALSGVAYRCGFCDQSHLTRTFKRLFGVTPGAYVAALRA
ncbi:MAG TPA: AraC family transcriptional regulator [Gemmatimonadaceae bacterium]|jgi:AraC-like DNA-binding protein